LTPCCARRRIESCAGRARRSESRCGSRLFSPARPRSDPGPLLFLARELRVRRFMEPDPVSSERMRPRLTQVEDPPPQRRRIKANLHWFVPPLNPCSLTRSGEGAFCGQGAQSPVPFNLHGSGDPAEGLSRTRISSWIRSWTTDQPDLPQRLVPERRPCRAPFCTEY
jgi:hypothetical protein